MRGKNCLIINYILLLFPLELQTEGLGYGDFCARIRSLGHMCQSSRTEYYQDSGCGHERSPSLQNLRIILHRCHDSFVVEEPDTLVAPMASCGFLHIDHLLEIELELADVMHLFEDPKVM